MDKKVIEDILKKYPFIADDIKDAQEQLNKYIALQEEARNPLKAQVIDGMPHQTGISDQTYTAVERMVDTFQECIDYYAEEIDRLTNLQKQLREAFTTLTEDEWRILYLRFNKRLQVRKIQHKMGIVEGKTFYKILNRAYAKIDERLHG